MTRPAFSDRAAPGEPLPDVTFAEAIRLADQWLLMLGLEPKAFTNAIAEAEDARHAFYREWQAQPVTVAGTPLVAGQRYDISVDETTFGRKPKTFRNRVYLGRAMIEVWNGPEREFLTFGPAGGGSVGTLESIRRDTIDRIEPARPA